MYRRLISRLLLLLLCTAAAPTVPVWAQNGNGAVVQREERRDLTADYAAFRRQQLSDVAYALSLDLQADSPGFSGEVEIRFSLAPGNISPLTVDFDSGEILDLRLNGAAAPFDYERWFLTLPATSLRVGENVLRIRYRRPFANDGAGLHKFRDPENGEVYLYTNFEPYNANRLFPHFDQPDLKAPLTLSVLAPADWQLIANTRETAIEDSADGRRHWHFPASAAISSYIYAMHAGPYAVWEDQAGDIPLRLFARRALAPYVKTEEWFEPTRQSFAFFQDWFDIPYPFGKYDQVIVPDFNAGAMENVGAVTFNEQRYITRSDKTEAQRLSLAYVIAHEMAHMWFGNLVTMAWWNGLWLNESFATFMGYLALERAGDFEAPWDNFLSGNKLGAYEADERVTTHPIELEVPATSDAFANFDSITYGKGASVLKQLPHFLGEEAFQQGIRTYLREHAWGNTELEDFVSALAEASGRDLSQWQREWLLESGVNTLAAEFSCTNGRLDALRLRQLLPSTPNADPVLRSQRVQVGLYRQVDGTLVHAAVLPVTYAGGLSDVPEASGQPCPDLVFANEDDWAYVKLQLDPVSLATLREHIGAVDKASTRLLLWQSQWDAVRDAGLSLTDYVDFVLTHLAAEPDLTALRLNLAHLAQAFGLLATLEDPQLSLAPYRARIEGFLLEQLDGAEPGSDAQKLWLDAFVSAAHSPSALDFLQALLQEERELDGLPLDQDRRWSLLIALNRHAHGDYAALLEAERTRDASDQGGNLALAAEAVRPDPAVKQAWLDAVLERPAPYKLATLRTVLPWLFPDEQRELLERFAPDILAAVPVLNAEGDQGLIDEFVYAVVPAACTETSVARLRQANDDFADFHPLISKAYQVFLQEDERCVRMAALLE